MPERYWFGCWVCGCSDVETDPYLIPARCPEHGRELIADNAGRQRVELDRAPISGLGVRCAVSADEIARRSL